MVSGELTLIKPPRLIKPPYSFGLSASRGGFIKSSYLHTGREEKKRREEAAAAPRPPARAVLGGAAAIRAAALPRESPSGGATRLGDCC